MMERRKEDKGILGRPEGSIWMEIIERGATKERPGIDRRQKDNLGEARKFVEINGHAHSHGVNVVHVTPLSEAIRLIIQTMERRK